MGLLGFVLAQQQENKIDSKCLQIQGKVICIAVPNALFEIELDLLNRLINQEKCE